MKKLSLLRGFTLVELLVVVAIIGILAAIILSDLGSARIKGVDVAIKAALANSRSQAGLFYDSNTAVPYTYTNICTNGPIGGVNGIGAFVLNAAGRLGPAATVEGNAQDFVYDVSGADTALGDAVCHDNALGWAAIVSLKKPGTASAGWCVDSGGASKEATSLPAAGAYPVGLVCP